MLTEITLKQSVKVAVSLSARLAVAAWLIMSPEAVIAQPEDTVRVSLSYEIKVDKAAGDPGASEAIRLARQIVYQRVRDECADLRQHIATNCKLTKLDIQQKNVRARRSGESESVSIRVRANFKIELNDQMK